MELLRTLDKQISMYVVGLVGERVHTTSVKNEYFGNISELYHTLHIDIFSLTPYGVLRVATKGSQLEMLPARTFTSPQLIYCHSSSVSIFRRHVILSLPRPLFPCGSQSSGSFT